MLKMGVSRGGAWGLVAWWAAAALTFGCASFPNETATGDAGNDGNNLDGTSAGDGAGSDGSPDDSSAPTDGTLSEGSAMEAGPDADAGPVVDSGDGGEAGCPASSCTVGAVACADGGVRTCEAPAGSCPTWVQTATCTAHETCGAGPDAGLPRCDCNATVCAQAGASCQDQQTRVTCDTDPSGCLFVSATMTCPSPQSCSGVAPSAMCSLTCTDSCQSGSTACVAGGLATCTRGSNGCLAYGTPSTCPGAHQSCTGVAGSATCTCNSDPTCTGQTSYCTSSSTLVTCSKDPQGCWYPSAAPQTCTNGACSGAPGSASCCMNACTLGTKQCGAGGIQTCVTQPNGCTDWGAAMACPGANQSCTGASGSATCTCNASACSSAANVCASGTAYASCSQDAQGCWVESAPVSCGAGSSCVGAGSCTPVVACTSGSADATANLVLLNGTAYWSAAGLGVYCATNALNATTQNFLHLTFGGAGTGTKVGADTSRGLLYVSDYTTSIVTKAVTWQLNQFPSPPSSTNNYEAFPNLTTWVGKFVTAPTTGFVFLETSTGLVILTPTEQPDGGGNIYPFSCVNTGSDAFTALAAEGNEVVLFDATTGKLLGAGVNSLGQCNTPATIASGLASVSAAATDGANVFFTSSGSVYACNAALGCSTPLSPLATGQGSPGSIAYDATNLYWIGSSGLVRCARSGCGGTPTVLVPSASITGGIAVDATSIYYLQTTTLYRLAK